jgi:hypothetical protein
MRPGRRSTGWPPRGVRRQHMGCAGGVENGINTVHLSYVREHAGHALIGARLWIPADQIADPVRSLLMGLPLDLEFKTKGDLAAGLVADAAADGVVMDFVCGDEVYGSCTRLRQALEAGGQAYVLRVPSNFRVKGQSAGMGRLIRAAGLRWPVEEDFEFAKDCFGIDQSQVRLYHTIARHTVLVMAALAICAVTAALVKGRASVQPPAPAQQPPPALCLVPLTVPEIRRLLAAAAARLWPPGHIEHWSAWMRTHQARARWYHQRAHLERDQQIIMKPLGHLAIGGCRTSHPSPFLPATSLSQRAWWRDVRWRTAQTLAGQQTQVRLHRGDRLGSRRGGVVEADVTQRGERR